MTNTLITRCWLMVKVAKHLLITFFIRENWFANGFHSRFLIYIPCKFIYSIYSIKVPQLILQPDIKILICTFVSKISKHKTPEVLEFQALLKSFSLIPQKQAFSFLEFPTDLMKNSKEKLLANMFESFSWYFSVTLIV